MQLFHSPTSPFVRKVLILLRETGQLDDVEMAAAAGTPLDSSKMPTAQNPLGKIPALVRGDGSPIFDSRAICQFLDHRAQGQLYPEAPLLWETLTLEALGDGIVDAAILMVYEMRVRPAEKRFAEWSEGQWGKVARAVDALEKNWIPHLNGPLDMGQVSVACALGYLDFRHSDRNWRDGHAALADWFATISERDSLKATVPVG